MIKRRHITPDSVFIYIAFNIPMTLISLNLGHESHLGIVTLRYDRLTWKGSLRDFLLEFRYL